MCIHSKSLFFHLLDVKQRAHVLLLHLEHVYGETNIEKRFIEGVNGPTNQVVESSKCWALQT